ncbi:UNKNOWN [Stylonychia lemnae]|uniref:Band 7 domain-containing protein n=1 Tax=Stylonychia lemnae TaxID=5949 RepID=A0A078AEU4_STYLE|nr:UNKNOWN [Stylonychia lemnae]|eukprot:CDW80750.1 UNKNOWN [Stylonychia lemnae]
MGRGGSKMTKCFGIVMGSIFLGMYFIASLILIGISVKVCEMVSTSHNDDNSFQENYCLNVNQNEQKVNLELYDGGRYWLGANHEFAEFPRQQMVLVISDTYNAQKGSYTDSYLTYIDNESIKVRSQEGLRVSVQLALHYKVGVSFNNKTRLAREFQEIYIRYGEKATWDKLVKNVVIASTKDACQNYQAFDFFEKRQEIGAAILNKTKFNLGKLGFTALQMPILNIDIPDQFSTAIKRTQIVKQQQQKYNYTKAIEDTKGQTLVKQELLNQEILLSEARARATATALTSQAQANSIQDALNIEKNMIRSVQNIFRTGSDNNFNLAFIWTRLIEKKIEQGVITSIMMDNPLFNQ